MRVMPHVGEAIGFGQLEVLSVCFARRGRSEGERVDEVVAVAADKEFPVIEIEIAAAHLPLAHAEALDPAVHGSAIHLQHNIGAVQIWLLRRPGAEGRERYGHGDIGGGAYAQGLDEACAPGKRSVQHGDFHFDFDPAVRARAWIERAQLNVNSAALLVEVARDIRIVDEPRGRGFQFDTTIEPAKALNPAHESLAAGHIVADFGNDDHFLARLRQIGDAVFVGAAIAVVVAQVSAVHPEPALGVNAANLEPKLLASPFLRHGCFFAIPGSPDIGALQRADAAFRRDAGAVAGTAHSLCLPGAGHRDGGLIGQPMPRLKPLLLFAHTGGISGKLPRPIETDGRPQGRPQDWIDDRRRCLTLLGASREKTQAGKDHIQGRFLLHNCSEHASERTGACGG